MMDAPTFYGEKKNFEQDTDFFRMLGSTSQNHMDIVILPLDTSDCPVDSDEEDDDDQLDLQHMPHDVSGEVEVHDNYVIDENDYTDKRSGEDDDDHEIRPSK